ncbi:hypothetical protein [Klebsiella aerogenes]|uniref:hypothetical protein n=1 Tax=Klebsiella aerogenes TaxID=548 RepID=UPI002279AF5E|nr:hypothetical protein [Klebsiella aerogenes]MCY4764372.1 hypothetical protein [Klebsiella aerogenes]
MENKTQTPLGLMDYNACGDVFLQKIYKYHDDDIFLSIKIKDIDSVHDVDFLFIKSILESLSVFLEKATDYLCDACLKSPGEFGYNIDKFSAIVEPVVSEPEITFWDNSKWSILFSDGTIPICKPYGILVNFDKEEIIDFDNLSDAEEV